MEHRNGLQRQGFSGLWSIRDESLIKKIFGVFLTMKEKTTVSRLINQRIHLLQFPFQGTSQLLPGWLPEQYSYCYHVLTVMVPQDEQKNPEIKSIELWLNKSVLLTALVFCLLIVTQVLASWTTVTNMVMWSCHICSGMCLTECVYSCCNAVFYLNMRVYLFYVVKNSHLLCMM